MFVEGFVSVEHLKWIKEAGCDVTWVSKSQRDLDEHGYSEYDTWKVMKKRGERCIRIFLNCDLEDFYTPEDLADDLPMKLLPLMAMSTHDKAKEAAIRKLKGMKRKHPRR